MQFLDAIEEEGQLPNAQQPFLQRYPGTPTLIGRLN
jgi:hypothetical protein